MTSRALILIDIQNDYFQGESWPVHQMEDVAANAARLLEHARRTGDMILHVRHEMESSNAPFFRPGSEGAEINGSVAPLVGEPVIVKHRPNAFVGTGLLARLTSNGVSDLTICGAMSQMCIDATVRAAVDHGFQVTVIEDACGAKDVRFGDQTVPAELVHAAFMAPLAGSYAKVRTAADYLTETEQR